eukprot:TRINITY_DN13271_c0_g1_i1.p2 TRINITY_DN13271_c0_g1~~TRINITY_DN13271_c0_g1_i1.p2  ORF type:complete len:142 (-),score=28.27 TRINITY_DN13271_c0_g1_i1:274-699(-)
MRATYPRAATPTSLRLESASTSVPKEPPRSSKLGKERRTAFVGYIGDYNGSPEMNEINMMKEIRARGPISVGMIFPFYFQLYDTGVLDCRGSIMPEESLNETQTEVLRRIRDEFRAEEHLVSIIGWGATKTGIKYWILQNS